MRKLLARAAAERPSSTSGSRMLPNNQCTEVPRAPAFLLHHFRSCADFKAPVSGLLCTRRRTPERIMKFLSLLLPGLISLSSSGYAQNIYKCEGPDGIAYRDRPCATQREEQTLLA